MADLAAGNIELPDDVNAIIEAAVLKAHDELVKAIENEAVARQGQVDELNGQLQAQGDAINNASQIFTQVNEQLDAVRQNLDKTNEGLFGAADNSTSGWLFAIYTAITELMGNTDWSKVKDQPYTGN
jgi:uncharacterized coiled-coil DUF342 family protein